jgi:predicted acyltransferase
MVARDENKTAKMPTSPSASSARLMSVDALRGFDMFWIVGGNTVVLSFIAMFVHPIPDWLYRQFTHPEWIGFTFWDLIMPTFLFIVGTSLPLAFAKRMEQGATRRQLYFKIVRRTLLLILLGTIANGHLLDYDLSRLCLTNSTLEAIACGYFVASIVMLNLPIAGQALTIVVLLVGYWMLMMFVPVPGHGAGVIEPHANVATALDSFIMGSLNNEETYTGVLTIMGYAATVLIGVMAGHLLRSGLRPVAKIGVLLLSSVACLTGGWLWATYLGFPIIKHCWSSSYVLWAAGWTFFLLTLFYTVIDVWGWRRWAFPFVVIGMNAITAYVTFNVFGYRVLRTIADILVGGLAWRFGPYGGPFLLALTSFMVLWLALWHLYRQKIFLRV